MHRNDVRRRRPSTEPERQCGPAQQCANRDQHHTREKPAVDTHLIDGGHHGCRHHGNLRAAPEGLAECQATRRHGGGDRLPCKPPGQHTSEHDQRGEEQARKELRESTQPDRQHGQAQGVCRSSEKNHEDNPEHERTDDFARPPLGVRVHADQPPRLLPQPSLDHTEQPTHSGPQHRSDDPPDQNKADGEKQRRQVALEASREIADYEPERFKPSGKVHGCPQ